MNNDIQPISSVTYIEIKSFVEACQENDKPAYLFSKLSGMMITRKNSERISTFLSTINDMLELYSPNEFYVPQVAVFFEACKDVLWPYPIFPDPNLLLENGCLLGERFNALVLRIKEITSTTQYKEKIRKMNLNLERQRQSAFQLVDSLFAAHSRLLVLRVDLFYRGFSAERSVSSDLQRFLRRVDADPRFHSLLGYVAKLEFGETRGLHSHLMVFLDGSKSHKDAHLAQELIAAWVEIVGDGAHGNNCNAKADGYKTPGIGIVNHWDTTKRTNLLSALKYFFKHEQQVLVKRKEKDRTLFMSRKKLSKSVTVGRPRTRRDIANKTNTLLPSPLVF